MSSLLRVFALLAVLAYGYFFLSGQPQMWHLLVIAVICVGLAEANDRNNKGDLLM